MSTLNDYLAEKREALRQRQAAITAPGYTPDRIRAQVSAEGRSGVRRIRVRGHEVITDSPPDFAGYDLGPSSPELALGALGSCLIHSWLIQAAAQDVSIEHLEVEVTGTIDPRADSPGHEATPVYPHDVGFVVHVSSPAGADRIEALRAAVDRACPILNLLRSPQHVATQVRHAGVEADAERATFPEHAA